MRTPGFGWVLMAAGLLLPDLGGAEIIGAKAIFTSGEGPSMTVETADSSAPTRRFQYPTSPKTEAAIHDEPQRERYIGFSYWAERRDGDGQHTRMTTDRTFRRGDRIRLNIMSNWSGYLYIVSLTSTGRSQVLFPHPAVSPGNGFVGHYAFPLTTDAGVVERGYGSSGGVGLSEGDKELVTGGRHF